MSRSGFGLNFSGFFLCYHFNDKQRCEGDNDAYGKNYHPVVDEAGNYICYKRNGGNRHCIRQLGRNVVDVVAAAAGGRHDGCVGNG